MAAAFMSNRGSPLATGKLVLSVTNEKGQGQRLHVTVKPEFGETVTIYMGRSEVQTLIDTWRNETGEQA